MCTCIVVTPVSTSISYTCARVSDRDHKHQHSGHISSHSLQYICFFTLSYLTTTIHGSLKHNTTQHSPDLHLAGYVWFLLLGNSSCRELALALFLCCLLRRDQRQEKRGKIRGERERGIREREKSVFLEADEREVVTLYD